MSTTSRSSQSLTPVPGAQLRYDDDGHPIIDVVTCGACGRSWNDAAISGVTPAPSGRCPFEYEHDEPGAVGEGVYSVPMELHVHADSAADALAIADTFPSTIYGNDDDSASLYVATDNADDLDRVE